MPRRATKTGRIELRTDPVRERRIRYAAELLQQPLGTFVMDAAAARAEEVIATSAVTDVPPAFFDKLWDALGAPGSANANLRKASRRRRFSQRA